MQHSKYSWKIRQETSRGLRIISRSTIVWLTVFQRLNYRAITFAWKLNIAGLLLHAFPPSIFKSQWHLFYRKISQWIRQWIVHSEGQQWCRFINMLSTVDCSWKWVIKHCSNSKFYMIAMLFSFLFEFSAESEEEKKRLVDQNIPYFAIRLTDIEVMENTFLRFMVKVLGEPQPKIQL